MISNGKVGERLRFVFRGRDLQLDFKGRMYILRAAADYCFLGFWSIVLRPTGSMPGTPSGIAVRGLAFLHLPPPLGGIIADPSASGSQ